MSNSIRLHTIAFVLITLTHTLAAFAADEVKIETGVLAGAMNADGSVRMFKNVPFAAPPVGDLRWKAPQAAAKWTGVRQADKFGSACMQTDVFGDIYFRDPNPARTV